MTARRRVARRAGARRAGWRLQLVLVAGASLLALGLGACGADGSGGQTAATLEPPVQVTGPGSGSVAGPPAGSVSGPLADGPPCTAGAIEEALNAAVYTRAADSPFTCEDDWAFAAATSGGLAERVVLAANGPRWAVLDRATACTGRQLPEKVRAAAC